jgi:hypothetical protein
MYMGHAQQKYNQSRMPRDRYLDDVPHKPLSHSAVRHEKDRYARELSGLADSIGSLFRENKDLMNPKFTTAKIEDTIPKNSSSSASDSKTDDSNPDDPSLSLAEGDSEGKSAGESDNLGSTDGLQSTLDTRGLWRKQNDAMRMYRMLRPDAAPSYEEDAAARMKAEVAK